MNRAAVIADWNVAVGTEPSPRSARLVELRRTVSDLKRTIAKLRQRNIELERRNQGAVTVIA